MYKEQLQQQKKEALQRRFKQDKTPDFIQRYFIRFYSGTRSTSTAINYYCALKDFFEWLIGKTGDSQISPKTFETLDPSYIEEYLSDKRAEGVSHNSLCTKKNILSSFWEYLIDLPDTNITRNIVKRVTSYKPDSDNLVDKLPTDEEINTLTIRLAMGKNFFAFYVYRILIGTGMRKSELINLDVSDVFLDGKANDPEKKPFVRVLSKGKYREAQKRIVYLTNDAKKAIEEWLSYRENMENISDKEALFVAVKGKSYGKRVSESMIDRFLEKNSNGITPHMLRHFYATKYAKLISAEFVRQQCGHSSINTTIDFYANGSYNAWEVLKEL